MLPTLSADEHTEKPADQPVIWGLSVRQLHDAYWNAHGVQCIRVGAAGQVDRTADLYLLIDADQLVLFDLAAILDRLTWRGAVVSRLRLLQPTDDPYQEQIVLDEKGLVSRIQRRYDPVDRGSSRVFLTTRVRLAEQWTRSESVQAGWRMIRRRLPRSRVDRLRITGSWFRDHDPTLQSKFLHELIERWERPDHVIDGLVSTAPGVWSRRNGGAAHANGQVPNHSALEGRAVGPIWLGVGRFVAPGDCLVGPAWLGDRVIPEVGPNDAATVRNILDIEIPETRHRTGPGADRAGYRAAKRAFDIACAILVLVGLSPVFAAIAVAILCETGRPTVFRHRRETRGGREFDCLKFRTMHQDSHRHLEELIEQNLCDGPQVMIRDDPRITRVGGLLRRTNLDELPQFWNVLVGEMSIVGPRPSPERENQICPAWRELRLSVRPGITGLWQLKRTRAEGQDFQEWIRYDIEYVRRAGFFFDLWICLQTARMMFFGRRADDE